MRLTGWILLSLVLVLVSDGPTHVGAGRDRSRCPRERARGLLRPLLPEFQKLTGRAAQIMYTGPDAYAAAQRGEADLGELARLLLYQIAAVIGYSAVCCLTVNDAVKLALLAHGTGDLYDAVN